MEKIKDKIVEDVKNRFDTRSNVGKKKYKTTLEWSDENFLAFANHLQEELMDATLYIEKMKQLYKAERNKEMTMLYHRILNLQNELNGEPIIECDLDELFHTMGYDIDKLPF